MSTPELAVGAKVVRLRPIRTLVIARDLAFRQRAATVLGDLGDVAYAILAPDATDEVLALVHRERADVVVLDVTGCENAVARVICELLTVLPRVGVVLVARDADRTRVPHTIGKWGWASELSSAVQQASLHGNPIREQTADAR